MKLRSIFRLAQNRTFNYIPRYYDPKKEQDEKRKKELLELVEIEKQKVIAEKNSENHLNNHTKNIEDEDYESDYERTISSAFNRKRKEKIAINTNQLLLVGVLVGGCLLFWNFGTLGVLFTIIGVVWIVFRMKMRS